MMPRIHPSKFDVFSSEVQDNLNGFVGWWPLSDGTLTDWSGNGRDGALVSTPTFVDGVLAGTALKTTASAYFTTPPPAMMGVNGAGDFSIAAWLFWPSTATASTIPIYTGPAGPYLSASSTHHPTVGVAGGSLNITGSAIATDVWHHFGITRIAGVAALYVDGLNGGQAAMANSFAFAATPSFGDAGFTVQDARMYSRGLTPEEMFALYSDGIKTGLGQTEGEWPMGPTVAVIRSGAFLPLLM